MRIRQHWVHFLRERIERRKQEGAHFKLQSPDRFNLVEWINRAWDDLPLTTIINGFVKCKILHGRTFCQEEEPLESVYANDVITALETEGALRGRAVDASKDLFYDDENYDELQ
ncbi:hypothetical protein AC1031_002340 [Aphanomyces cochlioides]|nr:hypothetical protein AC1031_002340 [Aphanomyces cochlioides]